MINKKMINKKKCCGCTACLHICPVKCIKMQEDDEGFLYPSVDKEKCIHCHKCEKVCPINKSFSVETEQKAFAAVSHNYSIWHRSASGGAFSEICRAWGDENTLVVGAAWRGFYVHHVGIVGIDNIKPLCNSKIICRYCARSPVPKE